MEVFCVCRWNREVLRQTDGEFAIGEWRGDRDGAVQGMGLTTNLLPLRVCGCGKYKEQTREL